MLVGVEVQKRNIVGIRFSVNEYLHELKWLRTEWWARVR